MQFRMLTLGACLAWSLTAVALACTAFQLKAADGSIVYFRSMEFGYPFNSRVLVVPRGTEFTGSAPGGTGMKWKATYGAVGLNVDVDPMTMADGQNEKGLAVGMLYLPGYSKYLAPDPAKVDRTIGSWQVANFLLTTCATTDEAVAALRDKAHVAEQIFPPFKIVLPVHYWIGDATGKVVIVEFVGGAMQVHDNPVGALTNSPPFPWQQINVSNYLNLSPVNVPSKRFAGVDVTNFGQGSGFVGIPGDFTPPSRFVRATLYSQWASQPKDGRDAVNLGMHLLNTFDIFNGAIQSDTADQTANTKAFLSSSGPSRLVNTDTTEWVVAHDRTNHRTYVRAYAGLEVQMIDLAKVDFAAPAPSVIDLKNEFAPRDISSEIKPLR